MAQQTGVDWLFETMAKTPMTEWYQVLEQAKEMHKIECISFSEKWESGVPHDSKEDLYDDIYKK
jgi:hypothetical protein